MSVVARGLRYQARAIAPPNWCGTPTESSISWSEMILGTRPPSSRAAPELLTDPLAEPSPTSDALGPQAAQRREPQRLRRAG